MWTFFQGPSRSLCLAGASISIGSFGRLFVQQRLVRPNQTWVFDRMRFVGVDIGGRERVLGVVFWDLELLGIAWVGDWRSLKSGL